LGLLFLSAIIAVEIFRVSSAGKFFQQPLVIFCVHHFGVDLRIESLQLADLSILLRFQTMLEVGELDIEVVDRPPLDKMARANSELLGVSGSPQRYCLFCKANAALGISAHKLDCPFRRASELVKAAKNKKPLEGLSLTTAFRIEMLAGAERQEEPTLKNSLTKSRPYREQNV
jgi:hypothetical protein